MDSSFFLGWVPVFFSNPIVHLRPQWKDSSLWFPPKCSRSFSEIKRCRKFTLVLIMEAKCKDQIRKVFSWMTLCWQLTVQWRFDWASQALSFGEKRVWKLMSIQFELFVLFINMAINRITPDTKPCILHLKHESWLLWVEKMNSIRKFL